MSITIVCSVLPAKATGSGNAGKTQRFYAEILANSSQKVVYSQIKVNSAGKIPTAFKLKQTVSEKSKPFSSRNKRCWKNPKAFWDGIMEKKREGKSAGS